MAQAMQHFEQSFMLRPYVNVMQHGLRQNLALLSCFPDIISGLFPDLQLLQQLQTKTRLCKKTNHAARFWAALMWPSVA